MDTDYIERICISVNNYCNLKCKYCYFPAKQYSKSIHFLSSDEILKILNRCNNYIEKMVPIKPLKINFVGEGEPLLNWKEIKSALERFNPHISSKIKFYTVTNGILITDEIANEFIDLEIFPSISLDGPEEIHDYYRIDQNSNGSFEMVIQGIDILRRHGFDIAINSTVTQRLINNIDHYMQFIKEQGIKKIIFGRLVDAPPQVKSISTSTFYDFLKKIQILKDTMDIQHLEIGNLEAYRRAINGNPEKVCTMFGSCCGAGTNNLFYLVHEVFPCGRFVDKPDWKLGDFNEDLAMFQKRMRNLKKQPHTCKNCQIQNICIADCFYDLTFEHQTCDDRKKFIQWFAERIHKGDRLGDMI